jgi:hypothetical protein
MAADQPDNASRVGIEDRDDRRLDIIPQTAKLEMMTDSDFSPIRQTCLERFANRLGIFPAKTISDIHSAHLLRRDTEPALERRIDPLICETPAKQGPNGKEKIFCEIPV